MDHLLAVAPHRDPIADLDAQLAAVARLVELCDRSLPLLGEVSATLAERVLHAFDAFVHAFDEAIRGLNPDAAAALGARVQSVVLPLLRRAGNGFRWYAKPRGYAGDFLTIAQMYDDVALGADAVGALLDRCFLRLPAAQAVQNRRALLADEIGATLRSCKGRPARVTSLAAGPARELFDVYATLADPGALVTTVIDLDSEALAYCAAHSARIGLATPPRPIAANLIKVALGRSVLDLADQDLVYSIGLIDYFSDQIVVKLLDAIHAALRPGGRVILGNFHPANPTKAVMDHVLDWKLRHRSESDMHALYRASAFGTGCARIFYEAQGINLFAEGVKAASTAPSRRSPASS